MHFLSVAFPEDFTLHEFKTRLGTHLAQHWEGASDGMDPTVGDERVWQLLDGCIHSVSTMSKTAAPHELTWLLVREDRRATKSYPRCLCLHKT